MSVRVNLAAGVLASDISAGSSSMTVNVGTGSSSTMLGVWPSSVPFYVTVMPSNPSAGVANSLDSEIMKVTAISGSTGTVTMTLGRAAKGTTSKAFSAGAIVVNGIYAEPPYLTTTSSGTDSGRVYTANNASQPIIEDGTEINIQFNASNTSGTPNLTVNGVSGSIKTLGPTSGSIGTSVGALISSGPIYKLVYHNSTWIVMSIFNKIGSSDINTSSIRPLKAAITIKKTENGTANAGSIVPLNTTVGSWGSGLSRSNGVVSVGSGISYVAVSASVTGDYKAGFKRFMVRRGVTVMAGVFGSNGDGSGYIEASIPEVFFTVDNGNTINLFNNDEAGTLWEFGTYLTVKGY